MNTQPLTSELAAVPALSAMEIVIQTSKAAPLDESQRTTLKKLCELMVKHFDHGEPHAEESHHLCMAVNDSGLLKDGIAADLDAVLQRIAALRDSLR